MGRNFPALIKSRNGSAAVEMALVMPMLLTLMFGSFELGNYFLENHVVAKAVRDGARYAARRSFADYTSCAASDDVITKTRNLTRTGQITGGASRIYGWTDPETITISVSCNGSYTGGIYNGITNTVGSSITGAPVITVTADVPYHSLFGSIGFSSSSLILRGRSQAAVMGI